PAVSDCSRESGRDLRAVPCWRQRQFRAVSAARQCAQSQIESRPLLCPVVHEPASGRHSWVLHDSHHTVAYSLALRPDQEKSRGRRKECLIKSRQYLKAGRITTRVNGISCASRGRKDTFMPRCSPAFWGWRLRVSRCVSAKASGHEAWPKAWVDSGQFFSSINFAPWC